jgi:hypothetical protein
LVECECDTENWRGAFFEDWLVMMDSFGACGAHQELILSLIEMQQLFFSDQNDRNLRVICEEFVQPVNGWWRHQQGLFNYRGSMKIFRSLVKCNVAERLNAIGVRKWRLDIIHLVERMSSVEMRDLDRYFDTILSKLVSFEREYQLRSDAAFLLELALWKSNIGDSAQSDNTEHNGQSEDDTARTRRQCRVDCRADTIIPNVLSYLIVVQEDTGTGSGPVKNAVHREQEDPTIMDLNPEKSLENQRPPEEVSKSDIDPTYKKYYHMLKVVREQSPVQISF